TATHAYLTYTLFYPRDWIPYVCVPLVCHDNDLEVALAVVERGSGALVFVETKAHHGYEALAGSRLARDALGHPLIEVESEGHGMYPVELGRTVDGHVTRFVSGDSAARRPAEGAKQKAYRL